MLYTSQTNTTTTLLPCASPAAPKAHHHVKFIVGGRKVGTTMYATLSILFLALTSPSSPHEHKALPSGLQRTHTTAPMWAETCAEKGRQMITDRRPGPDTFATKWKKYRCGNYSSYVKILLYSAAQNKVVCTRSKRFRMDAKVNAARGLMLVLFNGQATTVIRQEGATLYYSTAVVAEPPTVARLKTLYNWYVTGNINMSIVCSGAMLRCGTPIAPITHENFFMTTGTHNLSNDGYVQV